MSWREPRATSLRALRIGGAMVALIALLLWPALARADRSWNRPGWSMTFADEFSGSTVNPAKWNVDTGPNSANNEKQWYTPENVFTENGNLVIKSEVRSINGYNFASGKVNTAGRFSPHYGRIEVRAKLPTGRGIWPAHWLLPYGKWPPEIDITELIGSEPKNLVTSYHRGPLPPGCVYPWECGYTANTTVNWNLDWTLDFHTFAVEWDWWASSGLWMTWRYTRPTSRRPMNRCFSS